MFSVYCTQVGSKVLLSTGHILSLSSRGGAMVIGYRCTCGERGEWTAGASGRPSSDWPSSRPWPASASA